LRPRQRSFRARRHRTDLLRSSSSAVAANGSGSLAMTSLSLLPRCWCPLSAPTLLVLLAHPVAAGCVEVTLLRDVDEFILNGPTRRMSAAPAGTLAAVVMLAHRKSDPAIVGWMERHSPRPKTVPATTPASVICPVPFSCPCDADLHPDSSSSSRPLLPPERYPGLEDEMQVVLDTAPTLLLASPRASALTSNATSLHGMVSSQQTSSRCFQGNGDWRGYFAGSPGHSGHTSAPPPQLDQTGCEAQG
jgi:hypothetical protein